MLLLAVMWAILGTANVIAQEEAESNTGADRASYQLGAGDRIQVDVFNHEDLSGEFVLDGSGRFSMPLIGSVDASGLTSAQLEELLVSRLKPDYLVNPRVSVSVEYYRPYYMMNFTKEIIRNYNLTLARYTVQEIIKSLKTRAKQ